MVPPDGARSKLPTLSWDSVVDTGIVPTTPAPEPTVDDIATPAESVTLAPISLDPVVPVSPFEPLDAFVPAPLPTGAQAVPSPPSPPAPSTPEIEEPVTIRTTPPAVIVPAIGDVTSGPDSLATPAPAAPAPTVPTPASAAPVAAEPPPAAADVDALPVIQEATAVDALPVIQEATAVDVGSPMLPTISAPVLAPTPAAAPATSFEFDPASFAPAPTHQPHRRKTRGGLKLLAVLVVLGGLVAAALVFGQPYLFPGDWDDATAAYAEAVEVASGVEFAEPLSIVAEPTAEFAARLQAQFAAVSPEELAQWRALGLASGAVDDATLAGQLSGWQDAVYSTADGQVYHDSGAAGPELDAQLTQQMAAVSLDQQFGWSLEQPQRTLDAAAATSAEVLRQSGSVQEASTFTGDVPPVPSEVVDTLPPIIGYRMLAPHVYAEFETTADTTDAANPLADLGVGGPGFLGREPTTVASSPTMLDGDVATSTPVAKDRSFWYLVFAGYLDARTAHDASEAVVESAVTAVARGATQCVSATFAGTGVDETATLRSALAAWADAAPVEMASSFQVLPDGTLQLVSCDPGAGFDAGTRPGVARELLSWRMAELATMEAAVYGGGGETQFVDAWAFVAASPMALELMALPPTTSPADMAVAARAGFDALFAPAG
jgi:hypothetical protein